MSDVQSVLRDVAGLGDARKRELTEKYLRVLLRLASDRFTRFESLDREELEVIEEAQEKLRLTPTQIEQDVRTVRSIQNLRAERADAERALAAFRSGQDIARDIDALDGDIIATLEPLHRQKLQLLAEQHRQQRAAEALAHVERALKARTLSESAGMVSAVEVLDEMGEDS